MTRYLLTGATGFLGREVLVRLLERRADVLVTTRPRADTDAAQRLAEVVRHTAPDVSTDTMTVALGDVTQDGLGLDAAARAWLDAGPVQVVHGAAEVRFDLPYAHMLEQNVGGTKQALSVARQLADAGKLVRFDHVSTAYVAGDREDVAREEDVDVGQTPRNSYERTKLLAEVEVGAAKSEGLPVTVHRPSIIVGDSRTGRASSFKVLYWPMKVYARGRFRTLFGRPSCFVDVVPVDYVADAMLALFDLEEAAGKTFHLAAGPDRQSTIEELVAIARTVFDRKPVRYIDPDLYMRWLRPVLKPLLMLVRPDVARRGGVFLPYLRSNPTFSTANTDAAIASRPPQVSEYFDRIMRYARDTDFGRQKALAAGEASESG